MHLSPEQTSLSFRVDPDKGGRSRKLLTLSERRVFGNFHKLFAWMSMIETSHVYVAL